jgi:hypothetical protein
MGPGEELFSPKLKLHNMNNKTTRNKQIHAHLATNCKGIQHLNLQSAIPLGSNHLENFDINEKTWSL